LHVILITGATGKVGCDVVERLVADGHPVRALVRDPEKAAGKLPRAVELSRGDLADAESIEEALAGVEKMFLLAPVDERMLEMEAHATAAAKTAGVRHLVKLSAIGADAASNRMFYSVHGKSEQTIRQSGVRFTFLRPNFFMQNLLASAGTIKSQGAIYQPAGDSSASYIDTADIATVAANLLTTAGHEGKTYPLTGPQSLTYHEVADIVARVIGRPVKYVDVPRDAAKQSMLGAGMPEWLAEAISQLMDACREGGMAAVSPDMQSILGRPARTLEQFISDNRAAFL
jgi:uncharacterized protein YbjT (DUF2867 family)